MQKNVLLATILLLSIPFLMAKAAPDPAVDECLAQWKNAPFRKGSEPHRVIRPSVKVLGIGKDDLDDLTPSAKPQLVLIRPNVNVLGKTTFRLLNPNGWYCFKSNVTVLGKMQIEAHCKAHIATSQNGANVLGADESEKGVSVLGALRVQRVGCKEGSDKTSDK